MKLIRNIRESVGNYFFLKQLKKVERKRDVVNLDKALKIGLLFSVDGQQEWSALSFFEFLKSKHKFITALGYIKKKENISQKIDKTGFNYFSYSDLNWYLKPKNPIVNAFIEEEYDILIDLNVNNVYPIQYISGLSNAKLKVGNFDMKNMNYYDFMINVNDDFTVDNYIEQIKHYLNTINNKKETVDAK